MEKQLTLNEYEVYWLKRSLVSEIDRWEDRLESKRGTLTEPVISDRLTNLRQILNKLEDKNNENF
jgi:hypothetical protein